MKITKLIVLGGIALAASSSLAQFGGDPIGMADDAIVGTLQSGIATERSEMQKLQTEMDQLRRGSDEFIDKYPGLAEKFSEANDRRERLQGIMDSYSSAKETILSSLP